MSKRYTTEFEYHVLFSDGTWAAMESRVDHDSEDDSYIDLGQQAEEQLMKTACKEQNKPKGVYVDHVHCEDEYGSMYDNEIDDHPEEEAV